MRVEPALGTPSESADVDDDVLDGREDVAGVGPDQADLSQQACGTLCE